MSRISGMTEAVQRVMNSWLDDYEKPKYWEICGVTVCFQPVPGGVGANEWKETLDEWLPKYDEVGWLDGIHKIYIDEGAADNGDGAVGRYNDDGIIQLDNEMDGDVHIFAHSGSREAVLTHEMIHHAHLSLNGYEGGSRASEREDEIKQDVSWYAGTNIKESIAEIGAGIVHDSDFPDWVHEYYEKHDGPQEVYEIG